MEEEQKSHKDSRYYMGSVLRLDLLGESHRGSWEICSQETNVRAVPKKVRASAVSPLLTVGATAYWVSHGDSQDSSSRGQRKAGWDMFVSTR